MSDNGIAKAEDFKRALERANLERVVLPCSGLAVLLCRPPVFAAIRLGREGTELQHRLIGRSGDRVNHETPPSDQPDPYAIPRSPDHLITQSPGSPITRSRDSSPAEAEDLSRAITTYIDWLNATLTRLFVQPRFSAAPGPEEISLGDILVDDLKFIFRWLRGEVFVPRDSGLGVRDSGENLPAQAGPNPESRVPNPEAEDLAPFSERPRSASLPGGSGEARPLPPQRTTGARGDAGVPGGLRRG